MKQCPRCGSFFDDDNQFCLNDGTALMFAGPPSYSNEVPTVVLMPPNPQPAQRTSPAVWAIPVIGLLGALVVIFGYIAFFKNPPAAADQALGNDNKTTVKSSEKAQPVPTQTAVVPPAPAATPTVSTPQPPTPRPIPVTVTSRMRFNKGEITHTERGGIAGAGERIYLIRCLYGQSLSAGVASDNGCVTFDNGSATLGFFTGAGDNRIHLKNRCGPTNFSVTVTIR